MPRGKSRLNVVNTAVAGGDILCRDCLYWSPFEDASVPAEVGECRESPPSRPSGVLTNRGPVLSYSITPAETPKCGRFTRRGGEAQPEPN